MILFHPSGVLTAVLSLSISLPGTFSPCCMKDRSSLHGKREKTFWVCFRATKFWLWVAWQGKECDCTYRLYISKYTQNNMKYDPCSGKVGVVAHLWPMKPVTAVLGELHVEDHTSETKQISVECSQFMWVEGVVFVGFLINSWFCCADVGKPLRFLSLSWMLHCKVLQAELQTSSALSLAGSLPFLWLNV